MKTPVALLLLCLAFTACQKTPPPAPPRSLSGVWQLFGKDKPDILELEDNGGTLIGFYTLGDHSHQYCLEGTRVGDRFDLHGSELQGQQWRTEAVIFNGTFTDPKKINGDLRLPGEPARLWRAQWNIETAHGLGDIVRQQRAEMMALAQQFAHAMTAARFGPGAPLRGRPQSVTATPKPAPDEIHELAPDGVFYLVEAARVETESGVTGLPPGTGVKRLHDDVYLTPAGEAHLAPEQITNDMTLARQARDADRAAQGAAEARIAADGAILQARAKAEAASTPTPGETASAGDPLASSLNRPTDPLNTTHSSTKDKVYHDANGDYWKDIFGKKHYFHN